MAGYICWCSGPAIKSNQRWHVDKDSSRLRHATGGSIIKLVHTTALKHALVLPTPYTWPPTVPDEVPNFTEAISASSLYIRMTSCHPQGTIYFRRIFTHSKRWSTNVPAECRHPPFHHEDCIAVVPEHRTVTVATIRHYRTDHPSLPDISAGVCYLLYSMFWTS